MASQMCGPASSRPPAHAQETVDRPHACPRCQGFMVDDWLLDMAQGGRLWGTGRRCVNCGHIAPTDRPTDTMERQAPARRRPAEDERDWHEAA